MNGLPHALSPALQCAEFPQRRDHGQVLSLPGGHRSEVLARRDRAFLESITPVSVVEVESLIPQEPISGPSEQCHAVLCAGSLPCARSRRSRCSPAAARTCRTSPSSFPSAAPTFFADGRSVRPQVAHTVARGQLDEDDYFYTGLIDGKEARRDALSGDHAGAGARARSGSTSTARPATRAWATARE